MCKNTPAPRRGISLQSRRLAADEDTLPTHLPRHDRARPRRPSLLLLHARCLPSDPAAVPPLAHAFRPLRLGLDPQDRHRSPRRDHRTHRGRSPRDFRAGLNGSVHRASRHRRSLLREISLGDRKRQIDLCSSMRSANRMATSLGRRMRHHEEEMPSFNVDIRSTTSLSPETRCTPGKGERSSSCSGGTTR